MNINKGFISNKLKDIDNINKEISYISNILSSDNNINNIIIEQLEDVKKKYNQPRKTDIIYEDTIAEITSDDLIEDYTTTIIMSKEQYIKKTRKYSTTQKLKDGDEILNIQQCSNKGKIILLTNLGNAFLLNINDLEDKLPSQLGTYLSSLIDLQKDEYVLNMLVTDNYSGHVMIVFENGKIAKVPISSYKTKTNRKMLSNSLSLESKVVSIYQIDNDVEIELTDSFGKQKTINTSDINEKSKRDTIGVQVHNSKRQGFKIVSSKMINQ